jgi:uncharacterized protein
MSSRQQANLELATRFYDAIFSGDWVFIGANVTDDFAVVEAEGLPYGGTWKGVPGFQKLFAAMGLEYFQDLDIQRKAVTANDEYAMAYFRLAGTARSTGRKVDIEVAEVTTFRDGKIACLKPFYFDTKAVAAAFAS